MQTLYNTVLNLYQRNKMNSTCFQTKEKQILRQTLQFYFSGLTEWEDERELDWPPRNLFTVITALPAA